MDMSHPPTMGDWKEEKTLGSGGFGVVVLWRNTVTGEQMALKRCRLLSEMSQKNKRRWMLEVDIMKRLNHENVVKAMEVPAELVNKNDHLPLLAMEYCSGGDLRKVLNIPDNCCGLRWSTIRSLVKDIATAIEYLHHKRIIHRDLKPENIVLMETEDRVIYKLIDLGYAKELDQGSVCTSFVGTLQYLAPELLASQKYTCTVDYWSFGTVIFEVITGFRPFLPAVPPLQWHTHVNRKAVDDISVYYNSSGQVTYSKHLPEIHQLCRTLQHMFEELLRTMLQWDPKIRGGGLDANKRAKWMTHLETILDTKILQVLSVPSKQLFSYPLRPGMTLADLQTMLEVETKIPIADQEILLASGAEAVGEPSRWASEGDDDDWLLYLFRKNTVVYDVKNLTRRPLPESVQLMIAEPDTLSTFKDQKKSWGEAMFFCCQQAQDYRRLFQAQRTAMMSLLRGNSVFSRLKSKLDSDIGKLMGKIEFFKTSQNLDIKRYEEQAPTGISSKTMYSNWIKKNEEVEKYLDLQKMVTSLDEQSTALTTKIVELPKSPYARTKQADLMNDIEKNATSLYQGLRAIPRDQRPALSSNKKMVGILVKCLTQRENLTKELYQHLGKITHCKLELETLMPKLEKAVKDIKDASQVISSFQVQRQVDMWTLVKVALRTNLQGGGNQEPDLVKRTDSEGSSNSSSRLSQTFFDTNKEQSMVILTENMTARSQLESMLTSLAPEVPSEGKESEAMDWDFLTLSHG